MTRPVNRLIGVAGWRKSFGPALGLAAIACATLILPVATVRAAPPTNGEEQVRTPYRPVKSLGPRRSKLGGVRSSAPRKMEGLGGAKFPFRSLNDRSLRPRYSITPSRSSAPGNRDTGVRETTVGGVPVSSPGASVGGRGFSAVPVTPNQIRAALISGSGVRNAAFERSIRGLGFGDDVEVGPRIRFRPGDDAQRRDGPAQMLSEFLGRTSLSPGAAAALTSVMAPAQGAVALDIARRELGTNGFTEISLGDGDVGFVRTSNAAQLEAIRRQRSNIRHAADGNERWYEWEVRRYYNRRYDNRCDDDMNPRRVMHVMEGQLDPQIQHGPAGAPADTTPEPGFDAALAAIDSGRFAVAAGELSSYLAGEPEDMEVVRLLGIVQMLAGQTTAGIDTIGAAYEVDPLLAARPVGAEVLTSRPGDLRRALTSAVGQAHRTSSPRAWLAAAVLMDAEGRPQQAVKMIERAAAHGLDTAVANEMMLALRP